MDNLIDISFIIPCHNLESYIKPLLLSIHMLNLENITTEFIFVLDDCIDNTEQIIQQYMSDLNYRIIKCNVHAPGLARNIGFNNSDSKYVWFIDGDDWIINPEILQQVIPILEKNLDDGIIQLKFISNSFNKEHYSMVWQYIFRRKLIATLRFNNKQNFEDNDFSIKAINMNGKKDIPYLNIPSYYYNYCRPDSQTTKLRSSKK